ncbi:MAG TPA: hypothetical protein VFC90_09055 [Planctomycetota bacterium]|nr:hypothetical protein [Planctomycetota bacterium]
MEFLKIVALSLVAAVLYGIIQDQVTVRVCVEYFTIGHPPVFATDSPALLAFGWGVIATWWYGLLLGVPLAASARLGSRPKTDAHLMRQPMAFLLIRIACYTLIGGIAGYVAARQGWVRLIGPIAGRIPPDREAAFIAVLWAHVTAYGSAAVEGIVFCIRTWRRRGAPAQTAY